ncbi:hypothetical protein F4561_005229 [Lipingzhangella halophila]|uniref:Uncharacterized protein n=1 Tax=Lipingzhangella halophila TaxID=1783352 RepID=A0A7W7W602_9ACTN|nr:hypothetical protein [Lipingzhangella halophila]MBB4934409.1 hypothetical protein [Lipingzhangella halophila]
MIVALCSLAGAPGVSTLAVAVAAWWPTWQEPPVLVEADASGGDLADWRGLGTDVGVVSLAAQLRATPPDAGSTGDALLRHARMLTGGLPVVVAPSSAYHGAAAVQLLAANGAILRRDSSVTIVDVGRANPGSAGAQLMSHADAVVVVAHADAPQLRRVRESAPMFEHLRAPVGLAVRGAQFGDEEIAEQVGLPVWARVPHDDAAVNFIRGRGATGRIGRRPMMRAAQRLVTRLGEEHHEQQRRLRHLVATGGGS